MHAATIRFKELDRCTIMSQENDDLETPLLSDETKREERVSVDGVEYETQISQKALSRFKLTSFLIGVIFGSFLQAFTLGIMLIMLRLLGKELAKVTTTKEFYLLRFLLSYVVALMTFIIAYLLGKLVTIPLHALVKQGRSTLSKPKIGDAENDDVLDDLDMFIESRFCFGCLAGFGVAWSITDVLIGCPVKAALSLLDLVVILIVCRIMLFKIDRSREEDEKKNDRENSGSCGDFDIAK